MAVHTVKHPSGSDPGAADIVRKAMATPEELEMLSDTFKIFGDATRIKLLCALYGCEKCVGELCEALGMSQSAISHQLRLLKAIRLVKGRRRGQNIMYSIDDHHVIAILELGLKHIRKDDCDD
jgi:ArsR family transcriptional regulator